MHSIRSYIKAIEDIGFFESNIDCKENNVQRNIPLKQTAINYFLKSELNATTTENM